MLLTVPPGYSGGMPLKVDAPAAAVNVQNQMKHTSSAGTVRLSHLPIASRSLLSMLALSGAATLLVPSR